MGVGDDVAVLGDEEAGALAHAAARMERLAAAVVAVADIRAASAKRRKNSCRLGRKVVEAFRHLAAVGDGGDLGLHLHADDGRLHLLDDRGKVGRRDGVDPTGSAKAMWLLVKERAGAGGADDTEGEDAGEQRIADAPGSRVG